MTGFASMDWGFNAPGCCLYWIPLLDGHYHIYREYKFQQTPAWDVGHQIVKRAKDYGIQLSYVVGDPAMWQKHGHGKGESIAETLMRARVPMRRGDNDRLNGWQRVHELLRIAPDGIPWLTVDPSCRYLIRTMAGAVSDKNDPDDVDTHGDDHALDALRYGAMSRPSAARVSPRAETIPGTLAWYAQEPVREGLLARG